MVILNNGSTYIRQSSILPGLARLNNWSELFAGQEMQVLKTSSLYRHQLTHQEIYARFYMLVPLVL